MQDFTHRSNEVPAVNLLQEVHNYFCICLGLKHMPLCRKIFLKRKVILDDAVMDNCKIAVAIRMRMSVYIRRTPVRSPARMPDTKSPHRHMPFDLLTQCRKAPDALFNTDLLAVVDRNPC